MIQSSIFCLYVSEWLKVYQFTVSINGSYVVTPTFIAIKCFKLKLPVRPQVRPDQTDSGPVAKPSGQDTSTFITTGLSGPAVHVLDRSSNNHRKAGSPRPDLRSNW